MSTLDHPEAERIAALVDGALDDPAERARVAQLVEDDPAAARFAEELRRSNALLQAAFEAPMQEPMPPAMAALFTAPESITVTGSAATSALPRGDRRRPRPAQRGARLGGGEVATKPGLMALAASLLLGVFLGAQLDGSSAPDGSEAERLLVLGPGDGTRPVDRALERLVSGETSEEGIRPLLSFRAGDGRYCREFEVVGALPHDLEIGIACRRPSGGWDVTILVAAPPAGDRQAGAIVLASGPSFEALEAMLDALDAGPSLTPSEEAASLAAGWRRDP
ncbi:MAG: hypothetical protein AAF577_17420 [Pseudomonadota bacterium]